MSKCSVMSPYAALIASSIRIVVLSAIGVAGWSGLQCSLGRMRSPLIGHRDFLSIISPAAVRLYLYPIVSGTIFAPLGR